MTAPDTSAIFGTIKVHGGARSTQDRMTLYFDGGARPDPQRRDLQRMEIAVVAHGHAYVLGNMGLGDNCTAEWLALRFAAAIAEAAGARDVLFIGDARTIVEQALGRWRCRSPQLLPHYAAWQEAKAAFERVHVRHVQRSKNLAGSALARRHPR